MSVYGYMLDPEEKVLGLLQEDPTPFLLDALQELRGCNQGGLIRAAANLLVGDIETEIIRMYKSSAFVSGAATVLAAFAESDLAPVLRDRTQRTFKYQSMPFDLVVNSERMEAFENYASQGLKIFPEVRNHLDETDNYYASLEPQTAMLAVIGGGVSAKLLGNSFDAVIREQGRAKFGSDIAELDWDQLLKDETDGSF